MIGFELIRLLNQDRVIGLNASFGNDATDSFSAQLASVAGSIFTNLRLINRSPESRLVTLRAISTDGSELSTPVQLNLGAGESLQQDASGLFQFSEAAVGSLRIEADGDAVIGDVIFGDPTASAFAASLPLQTATFREAVFSQVADIQGLFFTGLAIYNPGLIDASVSIEIVSAEGQTAGQATRFLEGGRRLSELTFELVAQSAGQAGGYVLVRSDQPIIAQVLFGGLGPSGITLISAVPPTVIQQ